MKVNIGILILILSLLLILPDAVFAAVDPDIVVKSFPPLLSEYQDSHLDSLGAVLSARIAAEPLNLFASILFLLAIIHTFFAGRFLKVAKKLEQEQANLRIEEANKNPNQEPARQIVNPKAVFMHYLGEIEAVFGIWAIPLLLVVGLAKGWGAVEHYVNYQVSFTEPIFVVVVMAIAGTKPILYFAKRCLTIFASMGGQSPAAWWFVVLTGGTLLGSLITEPAAMTICAMLLAKQFYSLHPNSKLAYATIGLLFVNISIGGTLTHFAAPPVLMVSGKWGWGFQFMLMNFGWKAVLAVCFNTALYFLVFRNELARLNLVAKSSPSTHRDRSIPWVIVFLHLLFLAWTVLNAHNPNLLILGFLFFVGLVEATNHHQFNFSLRRPLLVGFFLAGLVLHGGFQAWWIAPVLSRLNEFSLYCGALLLTAFNDNAAITYLASLVPTFSDPMKYAVVAGAVAGGGLTIIANAPNPAGNAILAKYFDNSVSPLKLFLSALVPTLVASALFLLL